MKRIIACLLFAVLLCGCGGQGATEKGKLSVVATAFPVYDFVRAVGGDRIDLKLLIKPGSEVHSFEPAPSDIAAISGCDLFAFIGGESESWAETLTADNRINSLALIDEVQIETKGTHHHSHSHQHSHDEHIWTSPLMATQMINAICERLCEIDSEYASKYRANAAEYIEKIDSAAKEIKAVTDAKPQKLIVVADRFPFEYFAEYFGIEHIAALDGCAAPSDISLRTMAELTDAVESGGIEAVFCTELSNRVIANALSEQTGVRILELHSAHNVTRDDFLGGITYVDIMKRNAKALKEGMR